MNSPAHRGTLRIGDVRAAVSNEGCRVTADVGGTDVWFESSDVELRAAPEAFATAFLIPALHRHLQLVIADGVCRTWLDNVERLLPVVHEWWGLPGIAPSARFAVPRCDEPGATRSALCFSAGIDSFHSLLRSGERVDVLVTVQGFDIELDDTVRMNALQEALAEIAAEQGVGIIRIRTNVRSHPLIQAVPWERAHGGALAALAHVLDSSVGRLMISSSIVKARKPEPWGSHWQIDPLWSSARVAVANVGSELLRTAKLQEIAREPIVRRHLRVCWENRTPHGNCSRCEKCLVARLKLIELGMLEAFPVFEGPAEVVAHVDALPRIKQLPRAFNELASSTSLPGPAREAVRRLIRRTRNAKSFPQRLRRYLVRRAKELMPIGG